jgi:hypothetical protein
MRRALVMSAVTALLWGTAAASAAGLSAIVEAVGGDVNGVEFMDYLVKGQKISVPAGSTLVISYLWSCIREKIQGGEIVVGEQQSEVIGGRVERNKVNCDPGKLVVPPDQNQQPAGYLARPVRFASAATGIRPVPKIQLTLHGSSPLIAIEGGGAASIERWGSSRPPESLALQTSGRLSIYDYASDGRSLDAGAVYIVAVNGRFLVFRIGFDAQPGATPIIGRAILFETAR